MATAETTQSEHAQDSHPRKRKVMLLTLTLLVILSGLGVWAWSNCCSMLNTSR